MTEPRNPIETVMELLKAVANAHGVCCANCNKKRTTYNVLNQEWNQCNQKQNTFHFTILDSQTHFCADFEPKPTDEK